MVGGYKQFGREILWELSAAAANPHQMTEYGDMAIKNYYDKREQAIQDGVVELPRSATVAEGSRGKVYTLLRRRTVFRELYQKNSGI